MIKNKIMKKREYNFLKKSISGLIMIMFTWNAYAVSFDEPTPIHVNVGTGDRYFVLIPNVDDGVEGEDQNITFDYIVNTPELIEVDTVEYTAGDNYAVLYFYDKGMTGNASVSLTATNENDDEFERVITIPLSTYDTGGVNYGATEVAFWNDPPYKTDPTFKSGYPVILNETYAPDNPALDMFWGKMWGYIMPPETGNYRFYAYTDGDNIARLYLSTDDQQENIPAQDQPTATAGSPSGFITLEAGRPIYFEAFHAEIVNDFFLDIKWVTPQGGEAQRISDSNVFYFLDSNRPVAPENVEVNSVGSEQINISWDEGVDDGLLVSYMVYLNGEAVTQEPLEVNNLTVTGLEPDTDYQIIVLSVDKSNNYSPLPANVTTVTTYAEDNLPPMSPQNLQVTERTAFSMSLQWNEATDEQTGIYGYNIYVNGSDIPINNEPVFETTYKLRGLNQQTEYGLRVTALDAALNESAKSAEIRASTTDFQWDNPAEDTYTAEVSFEFESVAPATGAAVEVGQELNGFLISNKVTYGSFEDDRFGTNMGDADLEKFNITKNNASFSVVTEESYDGDKSAKLQGVTGDWIRHVMNLTMSDQYNYRLSFAAKKGTDYNGNINIRVFRDLGANLVEAYNGSVTPSESWEEHVVEFPGVNDATQEWKIEIKFADMGILYIDDVEFHVNQWYDPDSKFTTVGMDIIDELKPAGFRWGAIPANSKNFFESVGSYQKETITLGDIAYLSSLYNGYALITVGVNSSTDWVKDPSTFSNLIEYLNGPAGTTWGDVRIAEGYVEPFTETLKGIVIEMGNEVWGYEVHGADNFNDNYANYSSWAADMTENYIKSSPFFDPEKMWVSFSGRSPNMNYGLHNSLFTNENGQMDMLSISGYMGGNLNYDPSVPEGETLLGYHKSSYRIFRNLMVGLDDVYKEMMMRMGRIVPQYMYEGNLTKPSYNGTAGQGLTMMDYYASVQKNGVGLTNAFILDGGGEWRLIDNQVSFAKRPWYYFIKYFNQVGREGDILKTNVNSIRNIYDENGEVVDLNPVGIHAFHNEGSYGMAIFSRDFENDYILSLKLPDGIGTTSNGQIVVITSESFSSSEVIIEENPVVIEDGMLVHVPKHSAVYIAFDAEVKDLEEKPLGNYEYHKVTEIYVTTDGGRTQLDGTSDQIGVTVEVLPEDAFYGAWNYEIIDNSANIEYSRISNRVSTNENSVNGTSTIRFYARDGSGVYTDVEFSVVNTTSSGIISPRANKVLVFPNPVNDYLNIAITEADANARYEIYSILGVKVSSGVITNSDMQVVNLSSLKSGIYNIRIISGKEEHFVRVIKQ